MIFETKNSTKVIEFFTLCCFYLFCVIIAYIANPYALWCLVYSQEFADTIDLLDEIPSPPPIGSVEDAFMFFASMPEAITHSVLLLMVLL